MILTSRDIGGPTFRYRGVPPPPTPGIKVMTQEERCRQTACKKSLPISYSNEIDLWTSTNLFNIVGRHSFNYWCARALQSARHKARFTFLFQDISLTPVQYLQFCLSLGITQVPHPFHRVPLCFVVAVCLSRPQWGRVVISVPIHSWAHPGFGP